jgi:hypothetical protein
MNGLFPIIRRKRRPLTVEDVPPIPTKTEPVQSVVLADGHQVEPAESTTDVSPKPEKSSDDKSQH